MNGKPNTGWVCAGGCYLMTAVSWQKQIISGLELGVTSIAIGQGGVTLKQYDPFVSILVIPFAFGGGVSPGEDTLDRDIWTVLKGLEVFVIRMGLRQIKYIWHGSNDQWGRRLGNYRR